jgi:Ca-activated chloride channel homolog
MNCGCLSSNRSPYLIVLWILAALAASQLAVAQTDLSDVHIDSRKPDNSEPNAMAQPLSDTKSDTKMEPLKVDVNLVLVPVTVTDDMNRVVLGLDKENFQVYEDKQLQSVQHFSSTDVPISIGIIFDTSGSMNSKIDRAREAVVEFLKIANPQDEFFMIAFSDTPRQLVDFTGSTDEVQNNLILANPKGTTALLDAIYLGVSKMKNSKWPRKALLIISDGGDNHSRYTEKDVKRLVRESDTTIYALGIYDRYFRTEEERLGPELLSDISQVTGGRSFTIDNPKDLPDAAGKIAVELRNQYVLGYRPSSNRHDGKWHKIRVKLLAPKGMPPLQLFAKQGYYASAD